MLEICSQALKDGKNPCSLNWFVLGWVVKGGIGQIEVPIQRLLQFGPGSVLKLDKPIDAPVDLYLKDTRFATGNVVVVEDRFAVRIKEILGTGAAAGANNG